MPARGLEFVSDCNPTVKPTRRPAPVQLDEAAFQARTDFEPLEELAHLLMA